MFLGTEMTSHVYCFSIPVATLPGISGLLLFIALWLWRLWCNRGGTFYYFDAQDFLHYEQKGSIDLEEIGRAHV